MERNGKSVGCVGGENCAGFQDASRRSGKLLL